MNRMRRLVCNRALQTAQTTAATTRAARLHRWARAARFVLAGGHRAAWERARREPRHVVCGGEHAVPGTTLLPTDRLLRFPNDSPWRDPKRPPEGVHNF